MLKKKKEDDAVCFSEGSLGRDACFVCFVVVFGVTDSKTWSEPNEIGIWVNIVACPLSLFINGVLDKIICSHIQNEAASQVEFGCVRAPKQTVAVSNISAFTPGVKPVSVTADSDGPDVDSVYLKVKRAAYLYPNSSVTEVF